MTQRISRWATVVACLALAGLTACEETDRSGPTAVAATETFDTTVVHIETGTETFAITAELAETREQRRLGLMDRSRLPQDHGMLFIYPAPQAASRGFWMYRTRIPLDIAYLDADGRIVAIRSMDPCDSADKRRCPTYPAGVPWSSALEMNRGYFERRGITVGDRVVRTGADESDHAPGMPLR